MDTPKQWLREDSVPRLSKECSRHVVLLMSPILAPHSTPGTIEKA